MELHAFQTGCQSVALTRVSSRRRTSRQVVPVDLGRLRSKTLCAEGVA
jgi:hypothetical protein